MKVKAIEKNADFLGIVVSIACLVHCLVLPVLLTVSAFSKFLIEGFFFLDYLFIGFALVAVRYAAKKSSADWLKAGLWISFSIFSMGILLHDSFPWMEFVSIAASLVLVALHLLNLKIKHPKK
jgi:hypothetical protein